MNHKDYIPPKRRGLGEPLPNTKHAVSVSLPTWKDVIGYEENEPRVIEALQAGYPRFTFHPTIKKLFAVLLKKFGDPITQGCLAFPSRRSAKLCKDYIEDKTGNICHIHKYEPHGIYTTLFRKEDFSHAKDFWQHTGLILSSRQAEDILENNYVIDDKETSHSQIIQRLSHLSQQPEENIYLYASGMTPIYEIHKALDELYPKDCKTIQLGFPYVDTLKIQEKFGRGCHLVNSEDYIGDIRTILETEKIAALFCEIPSNPELKTIDVKKLSELLTAHDVLLIIDDTVSAWQVDLNDYADLCITSLTKYFSGYGDVLAGSLIINNQSKYCQRVKNLINASYENTFYGRDIDCLSANSIDFSDRMKYINQSTEIIIEYLLKDSSVEKVLYPELVCKSEYDAIKKPNGGYGGLFSIILKDLQTAQIFYDNLSLCKGPSLGTNFTLVCPYIFLAHYNEMSDIEKHGIPRHLIRFSIGLEPTQDIIEDIENALSFIG